MSSLFNGPEVYFTGLPRLRSPGFINISDLSCQPENLSADHENIGFPGLLIDYITGILCVLFVYRTKNAMSFTIL